MDTYIFYITLKTNNLAAAHQCIMDAIAFIIDDFHTTVTAFAVASTHNYVAIAPLPGQEAAMKVATDLSIGGDASVAVTVATSLDTYTGIIDTRGNKKGGSVPT